MKKDRQYPGKVLLTRGGGINNMLCIGQGGAVKDLVSISNQKWPGNPFSPGGEGYRYGWKHVGKYEGRENPSLRRPNSHMSSSTSSHNITQHQQLVIWGLELFTKSVGKDRCCCLNSCFKLPGTLGQSLLSAPQKRRADSHGLDKAAHNPFQNKRDRVSPGLQGTVPVTNNAGPNEEGSCSTPGPKKWVSKLMFNKQWNIVQNGNGKVKI